MRVVGGKYRSRVLNAPKGDDIRPTSDKLRGAIFNMLRSRGVLNDAQAMDVFCGTGALGIEALSQGAATCVFMDSARNSVNLAKENATTLKIGDEAVFILSDAAKAVAKPASVAPRDLIFLDPPYRKNLITPSLESLKAGGWIADDAFFVIEVEKGFNAALPAWVQENERRDYGETTLILAKASPMKPE